MQECIEKKIEDAKKILHDGKTRASLNVAEQSTASSPFFLKTLSLHIPNENVMAYSETTKEKLSVCEQKKTQLVFNNCQVSNF